VSLTKRGQDVIQGQLALRASRDIIQTLSEREMDTLRSICGKMRAEAFRLIREIRPTPYDEPSDYDPCLSPWACHTSANRWKQLAHRAQFEPGQRHR
jgi:hypothetical protein